MKHTTIRIPKETMALIKKAKAFPTEPHYITIERALKGY
jgi:hypothetical protein